MFLIHPSDPKDFQPIEVNSPLRQRIKRLLKAQSRNPDRVKRRIVRRVRKRVRAVVRLVRMVRRARAIRRSLDKLKALRHEPPVQVVVIDAEPLTASKPVYGRRAPQLVTILKEGIELCASGRKAGRKNAFSPKIDSEMAQEQNSIAREFHALWANDISENEGLLNMRLDEMFEELKASTDADNIGTLAGTMVLQKTLDFFRIDYPLFSRIYTDFSDQPALLNQTLETRKIGSLAIQTFNNQLDAAGRPQGWSTVSPATTTDVPISVTQHIGVPVVFGANTLSSTLRKVFEEMSEPQSYAIAKQFVQLVYALFTPANYNAYAVINGSKVPVAYASYVKALGDFGRSAMVDLNAIFNPNEVLLKNRCVVLNSAYYGQASKDPSLITFWAGQQDPEIITEGELPKMSKFIPIEAPDLPTTNNLVGMALQKNGAVAISRIPADYTKALPGASYGVSSMVTDPQTGMSLMLVQYVNHTGGYAESRMESMIGAAVGDNRGGLCITSQ
ncbi:MAG TPA: hypothetical protein VKV04_14130 [Verrucomicrobiae bacterium]|nr:hypothetical protein [Verrucomicrobiae bacterium]